MPKDVKFNIKLNIDGKEQIVTASTNTKSLADSLGIAKTQADKLRSSLITFTQANSAIQGLSNSLQNVMGSMTRLIDVNTANVEAETKLANNMRNTMSATEDDVQAIKDLCAAQQELGVISQGTQTAGAQELATYLEQKSSLETLIPVMNDMLAQQYGLNATSEQAATIASMLGKVMDGQTGALSRYGYSFTEAQEQILKFGTEEERAATLADVVTAAVGGMNKELAKTDAGQAKQAAMRLDDLRASAGVLLARLEPMIKQFTGVAQAMLGVGQAATGIMGTVKAVNALTVAVKAANVATKSLMGLGVGAALAALTVVITKLTSSTKEASEATEALKSAQEAGVSAQANAKVEIDSQIKKLKDLKDRNADTSDAVKNLNDTYGNIFGTYKTANDWIQTLTKNQEAYVKMIGYEAQQRELASKAAAKEVELAQKRAELEDIQKTQPAYQTIGMAGGTTGYVATYTQRNPQLVEAEEAVDTAQSEFDAIKKDLNTVNELAKAASDSIVKVAEGAGTAGGGGTTAAAPQAEVGYIDPGVYNNLQDYADKLADLQKQRMQATKEQLANIDEEIKAIEAERDAFLGLTNAEVEAIEEYRPAAIEKLNTLNDLSDAIRYYQDQQGKQGIQEAQDTQKVIDLLQQKEKTMRGLLDIPSMQQQVQEIEALTGKEYKLRISSIGFREIEQNIADLESMLSSTDLTSSQREQIEELISIYRKWEGQSTTTFGAIRDGWKSIEGLSSGIQNITSAIEGNGNAWEKTTAIIDGFIRVCESISAIIGIISSLKAVTEEHTVATTAEAAATIASTGATAADITMQDAAAVATLPVIATNKAATASYMELAAAEYFAAHAYIPFAGFGIASGFVAASEAMVAAIGAMAFAQGGVVSGPTLALVGEYAGASNNPEVIAPLDRLRSLIKTSDDTYGKVKFEIEGRTLRGILTKEYNLINRS